MVKKLGEKKSKSGWAECRVSSPQVKNSKPEIEETMKMLAVELTGDELDLKRRKTELRALAWM